MFSFFSAAFSQKDGYWDKERTTSKEIKVGARDRIIIKTEDFPIGTTEVMYRITLLDNNQQLASSLVSVLKAIPDPTGISQGSAGAVFIASKISGSDQSRYAIFSDAQLASQYKENGSTAKACFSQDKPVSKDARLLSVDKSFCMKSNTTHLWFAFESKNWIMNQKIILEVVPWIDYKRSKGWNTENRKTAINQIKTSELVKKMIHSDDFSLCILEKLQEKFKFQEFQELLSIEKSKTIRDFGYACLTEKPANQSILNTIRADAAHYFKNKKYKEAIDLLLVGIVDNGNATIPDYNALGNYYLYTRQYEKASKVLLEGIQFNDSELQLQLTLAHLYLFTGQLSKAKSIHKKYKTQNISAQTSWINKTKSDFDSFQKAGLSSDQFKKILRIIE